MGKVIKILFHIISGAILAAIILPIWLALMLYLPPVQHYIVKKATQIASEKIGSRLEIGKIKIGLFNRVVLEEFYVEDMDKDTMLYVKRLDVGVDMFGLIKNGLAFDDVILKGVKFNVMQQEDGTSNFKKVLVKLTNPEKKVVINLRIKSVKIEDMEFKHRKYEVQRREYGVNFNDVDVQGLNLKASNLSILGDSISVRVKSMALKEKSGLVVDRLSCEWIDIADGGISLDELSLKTPDSELFMEYLRLDGESWKEYSDFTNKVRMESKMYITRMGFQTLGYFAPQQRGWQTTLSDANLEVSGTVNDMSGRIENARINEETELKIRFAVQNIITPKSAGFDVDIEHLQSSGEDIEKILNDLSPESSVGIVKSLKNMGDMSLTGHFDGSLSRFTADMELKTTHGGAELDMNFIPASDGFTTIAGSVSVYDLDIGRLLDNKELGHVTIKAGVDGELGNDALSLNTKAEISSFDFNGYRYKDIFMNGMFENRLFVGSIASSDPNIEFNFDGVLDFNDSLPKYDFDLNLLNADLHRLNFNTRDSISVVKCRVTASAIGTNADNLNGEIKIDNLRYISQADSIVTGEIRIIGENDEKGKYLAFRSLFADAEYRSRTSYVEMIGELRKMMTLYAPTLTADEKQHVHVENGEAADAGNYSLLKVNIKQANNIAGIFVPGLIVAVGSKLSFMFNPQIEHLSLAASSDYIEYGDNFISKLDINTRNEGDSISLFVRAGELYVSGFYFPDFSIIGSMKDNQMNAALRFADTSKRLSALMGVTTRLERDTLTGMPQMNLRFSPSTITSGDQTWNIYTRGIVIDSTKVRVDNFVVSGSGQSMRVNGTASRSNSDTLSMTLTNFDLEPLSKLTSRAGYMVEGVTNGRASIVSALDNGALSAHITFDSIRVNGVEAPSSLFSSFWDFKKEQAQFMVVIPQRQDTVIRGYYSPKDKKYVAKLEVEGADLSLLDPIFKGVISNTNGAADIDVRLTGEKKKIRMDGAITIPEVRTTVDFLKVPYTLKEAKLEVANSVLILPPTDLTDPQGNKGKIDMRVNLSNFNNIVYDINVRPENLMVLNTTEKDNDLFYGKVFGTGRASIKGDKRGVNMDIVATTSGRSEFFMPLSGGSKMGVLDIITFVNPKKEGIDSTDYVVRKQLIIDRRNKAKKQAEAANMSIKLVMNVRPNTDFQLLIDPRVGDILKARGNGSLTLNVNPSNNEFSMYGDYEITEGSYQFTLQDIISKRFTIVPGSKIMWTGEPSNALLNVTAIYKLKASLSTLLGSEDQTLVGKTPVECHIMLGDRLSQPEVTFKVEVPETSPEIQAQVANALGTQESMATQFFFLLAANSFYSDTGGINIGAAGGSATAFEFLSNQLGNWISTDKFDIGIRYSPKGDMSSDEVNIDLSTQLFKNRLILEAEGNYDTGNNPTGLNNRGTNNLSGDFSLTWLIDPAGNLRAKGFTRTINRYDENQGMQEGGIGLYYKEDFNTVKDIVTNFKERFSNWGRKRKDKKLAKKHEAEAAKEAEVEAAKEAEAKEGAAVEGEAVEGRR